MSVCRGACPDGGIGAGRMQLSSGQHCMCMTSDDALSAAGCIITVSSVGPLAGSVASVAYAASGATNVHVTNVHVVMPLRWQLLLCWIAGPVTCANEVYLHVTCQTADN